MWCRDPRLSTKRGHPSRGSGTINFDCPCDTLNDNHVLLLSEPSGEEIEDIIPIADLVNSSSILFPDIVELSEGINETSSLVYQEENEDEVKCVEEEFHLDERDHSPSSGEVHLDDSLMPTISEKSKPSIYSSEFNDPFDPIDSTLQRYTIMEQEKQSRVREHVLHPISSALPVLLLKDWIQGGKRFSREERLEEEMKRMKKDRGWKWKAAIFYEIYYLVFGPIAFLLSYYVKSTYS